MKMSIATAIIVAALVACVSPASAKSRGTVRVPGGASLPQYGLAFDASYDSRFDGFVPGYKIVQVAIINNSFNIIPMDPKNDQWVVRTTEGRKSYRAFPDLKNEDPKAWNELPERARKIISYPLLLPIGARQVIDLFVPDSAPLDTLVGVDIDIKSLEQKFQLVLRE